MLPDVWPQAPRLGGDEREEKQEEWGERKKHEEEGVEGVGEDGVKKE